MNTIDRYLGTRIISALLKPVAAFVLLYVLIDWNTTQQRAVEKYDVPWAIVIEYYASHVPTFIFKFQAMALALLVATLFVLGKAAQNSEITALLAGGVSMARVARAPVIIALFLSLAVFLFENTLGVKCAVVASQLEKEYFKRALQDSERGPSWTGLGDENWSCHILRFNRAALTGTNVFIHAVDESGTSGMQEIRARRIYWAPERNKWILEDGRWATIHRNPSYKNVERITQITAPFAETPGMLFALEEAPETKTVGELRADLKNAELMGLPSTGAQVAYHTKFSRPALCFIIVWLAIPLCPSGAPGGDIFQFWNKYRPWLGLCYPIRHRAWLGHPRPAPPRGSGLAGECDIFGGGRGYFSPNADLMVFFSRETAKITTT